MASNTGQYGCVTWRPPGERPGRLPRRMKKGLDRYSGARGGESQFWRTGGQADRRTGGQADRWTGGQADRADRADRWTGGQGGQADRRTRRTRRTGGQADRRTRRSVLVSFRASSEESSVPGSSAFHDPATQPLNHSTTQPPRPSHFRSTTSIPPHRCCRYSATMVRWQSAGSCSEQSRHASSNSDGSSIFSTFRWRSSAVKRSWNSP